MGLPRRIRAIKNLLTEIKMAGKRWTDKDLDLLKKHYPNMQTQKVADMLGRTYASVSCTAINKDIRKSEEYLSSSESGRILAGDQRGIGTRYQKGRIAENKGRPQSEWMSLEGQEICRRTAFKPGNKPHNIRKVGDIANHDGYDRIKVAEPDRWEYVHRLVWECANGPIPNRMIVQFKNGDQSDCRLENLMLRTRKEAVIANSIHHYPEELKLSIKLKNKLLRKLKEHGKRQIERSQ